MKKPTKAELLKEKEVLNKTLSSINQRLDTIEEEERKKLNSYEELNTFFKCCKEVGEDVEDSKFHTGDKDTIAYEMLKVIVKAINGGKTSDRLYYPYFDKTKTPGSGFDFSYFDLWSSTSSAPSRLGFIDSPRALFAAKTFESVYFQYIV